MRILQLHNRHQARGGADEVLEQEATLLASAGHAVEAFTLEAVPRGAARVGNALSAVSNREASGEVARRIESFRPDIVHVHTPFPLMSPAVFRVATRMGCATATTVHSYRYSCIAGTCLRDGHPCEDCIGKTLKLPGVIHRCYHDSVKASAALTLSLGVHHLSGTFSRHVGRFIALTDFAGRLLVRDGIPAEHVVVKPNSVPDPGPPDVRAGPIGYALFAGRFVEEKGIRTLLDAWRIVGDRVPLRIAGDGPLRDLVVEAAADNPMIEYLGWLDEDGLTQLIAGADIVVIPSEWYEAQPLVLLRAFAAGRAVACTELLESIGASVVHNDAGVSFPTGEASSLAEVVLHLAASPEQTRDMGRRARDVYEASYTPSQNLRSLERIYDELVGAPRP